MVEVEASGDGDGVGWMSHDSRRTPCPHCSPTTPLSAPTIDRGRPKKPKWRLPHSSREYSGRTLEAYRHDLRYYFQWAADQQLAVLDASRAHIEIYRSTMEQRRLAASTIDRRLTTVCGYYRFAHIDGRIPANPAQYVRRPENAPADRAACDGSR